MKKLDPITQVTDDFYYCVMLREKKFSYTWLLFT